MFRIACCFLICMLSAAPLWAQEDSELKPANAPAKTVKQASATAETKAQELPPTTSPGMPGNRWIFSVSTGWTGAEVGLLKKSINAIMMMNEFAWDALVDVSILPFDSTVNAETGGMAPMGEIGYRVGRIWGLGVRGGMVSAPTVTGSAHARGQAGDYFDYDGKYECSLAWFGAGAWVEVGKKVKGRGFFFLGPAFGKIGVDYTQRWFFTDPDTTVINLYTGIPSNPYDGHVVYEMAGSCLAVELGVDGSVELSPKIALFGGLSYRMSEIGNMEIDRAVDLDGNGTPDIRAGETVKTGSGGTAAFDFGGVNFQGGLRLSF